MQIASISSSTGPLLSVTHTHASAVGNAENSCLKGQRLPRRTGQASCQLLPPALLLTIWVLASGSCEDRPAVFSLDAVRGYFRGSLYFGAFPSSDILNVQIQIPVRSEQESWNTPRSVCPLGKSCRGGVDQIRVGGCPDFLFSIPLWGKETILTLGLHYCRLPTCWWIWQR